MFLSAFDQKSVFRSFLSKKAILKFEFKISEFRWKIPFFLFWIFLNKFWQFFAIFSKSMFYFWKQIGTYYNKLIPMKNTKFWDFETFYFHFEIQYHGQILNLKFFENFLNGDKMNFENFVWRLQPIVIRVQNIFADFVRLWRIECSRTYPLKRVENCQKYWPGHFDLFLP